MEEIINLMPWLWGSIILITIVIELFSVDIDALWFTIGATIALILSLFKLHIAIQLSSFVGLTIILLFTIGRLAKKSLIRKQISENSDSLIGKEIFVLEQVNEFEKGSGVINDVVWTLTCQAGIHIEKGKHAIIIAIDDNSLVVTNKK